jgi:hypothetical protein
MNGDELTNINLEQFVDFHLRRNPLWRQLQFRDEVAVCGA